MDMHYIWPTESLRFQMSCSFKFTMRVSSSIAHLIFHVFSQKLSSTIKSSTFKIFSDLDRKPLIVKIGKQKSSEFKHKSGYTIRLITTALEIVK